MPTLSTQQRQVLEALLFAPHHAMSAGELRAILGLKDVVTVNSAFGKVGRRVREVLGIHPENLADGEYEWWHILATGESTSDRGFVWTLRPDVVAALTACGFSKNGDLQPNEVQETATFTEGAVRQVSINAYDRNPVARARCIEVYGSACVVCGFSFEEVYGAETLGCIHVHHLHPLSVIGTEYQVDPVTDLRPVCPNCHAVIHRTGTEPPRSIEEVKAMIKSKTQKDLPYSHGVAPVE